MDRIEALSLIDYNYWVNERILAAAAALPQDVFASPGAAGQDSVRDRLVHALSAERVWRMRCQGQKPDGHIPVGEVPDIAALAVRWREEEAALRAYVDSLADGDFDRNVEYTSYDGKEFATPLWQILLHVVNHGTQTRTEAATLLSQLGHSPGDIDYIIYLRRSTRRPPAVGRPAPSRGCGRGAPCSSPYSNYS